MKFAWKPEILVVLVLTTTGCVMSPGNREDAYDSTRASDTMAPDNVNRGTRTMTVTTRTPPELDVRLVTFYTQFRAQPPNPGGRVLPRSGKPIDGCWWSRTSLLQEERFYYSRVFYYPVSHGTHTQKLALDEIVPGTCPIELTGVGYEVTLRAPKGQPLTRYRRGIDVAVEDGGLNSANAIVLCRMTPSQKGELVLGCKREGQGQQATFYLGPLSTSGAALTLDFRWEE
ncbi:hypothetical protein KIH07_03115 [Hydrogenophaga taeniospiralis]|nr:hypothetical protein [Hydrogenophaga taeniospiralis]